MALGRSGISNARGILGEIRSETDNVYNTNQDFLALFNDSNFQMFVEETGQGATINEALQKLSSWITDMCNTVSKMSANTENYLNRQENINK